MKRNKFWFLVCVFCFTIINLFGCFEFKVNSNQLLISLFANNLQEMEQELKNGTDPNGGYSYSTNGSDVYLLQPFEEACYLKNLEAINLMFDYGAKVTQKFLSGASPLHLACLPSNTRWVPYQSSFFPEKQFEVVEFLLEKGADPNAFMNAQCADTTKTTSLMYLLIQPGLNEESLLQVVSLLFEHGANITPFACLYIAVRSNYFLIADELLAKDADINAKSELKGESVLTAMIHNIALDELNRELYLKGAEYLLDKGADFRLGDSFGKTAYDYAVEMQLTNLVGQMDQLEQTESE